MDRSRVDGYIVSGGDLMYGTQYLIGGPLVYGYWVQGGIEFF